MSDHAVKPSPSLLVVTVAASEAGSGHIRLQGQCGVPGGPDDVHSSSTRSRRRAVHVDDRSCPESVDLCSATLYWFLLHCPGLLPKQFTDCICRLSYFVMFLSSCHCGISLRVCCFLESRFQLDSDWPRIVIVKESVAVADVIVKLIIDVIISYCVR